MFINNPNPTTSAADITKFGGTNIVTGAGESGLGIPRVTVANDSGVAPLFVTGALISPGAASHADYTPNADCLLLILTNTSDSLTVYVRDQAATTGVRGIGLNPGGTLAIPSTAAIRITNAGASTVDVTVNELRKS